MLDENLPTFRFKQSSDNPLASILFLTQHGADPTPEYILRRADPAQPASRNKYAVALCSPFSSDVVYAEVVVTPEWTAPTLSAAEIRAQGSGAAANVGPMVPDSFSVQLYNPDQTVALKLVAGGWNKSDSWEFEIPTQSFRMPTASELDRQQQNTSPGGVGAASELTPRIMFRWKKDSKLSKDMTCYMAGKSLGGRKSKEPDITLALFKVGKDSAVTIYEPNLQRVEVEDRKGLEVVLLLSAEVIKDLYLSPKHDIFNTSGASASPTVASGGGRRKNSHPNQNLTPSPPFGTAMSGALGITSPPGTSANAISSRSSVLTAAAAAAAAAASSSSTVAGPSRLTPSTAEIDLESQRLIQKLQLKDLKEEEELKKRHKEEEKKTKELLAKEEAAKRAKERKAKQQANKHPSSPPLPPRQPPYQQLLPPAPPAPGPWYSPNAAPPPMPPRPVSTGPGMMLATPANSGWWRSSGPSPSPQPQQSGGKKNGSAGGGGGSGGGGLGLGLQNPAASVSGFFGGLVSNTGGRREEERRKMRKKSSMHW